MGRKCEVSSVGQMSCMKCVQMCIWIILSSHQRLRWHSPEWSREHCFSRFSALKRSAHLQLLRIQSRKSWQRGVKISRIDPKSLARMKERVVEGPWALWPGFRLSKARRTQWDIVADFVTSSKDSQLIEAQKSECLNSFVTISHKLGISERREPQLRNAPLRSDSTKADRTFS